LFTDLNPHIFFGGDSVAFWGPLSWTMIFGLSFATFLTLILVPVMYFATARIGNTMSKEKMFKNPFSFDGRIRRTEFGSSFIIYLVICMVVKMIPAIAGNNSAILSACLFLIFLGAQFFIIAQAAKRCHDIGLNGWMQLIPLWNFVLLFRRGTSGSNEYGEDPTRSTKVHAAVAEALVV
ncbi:MAG TPA: DUF805 domain-containing protein, partial [Bacteroidia bacterium]|nr:DUF805 domain-containing protein [Bacteroidia bacterium]